MKSSKKYYKYIDLIRLLSCISVFFYHVGIMKGGYLAVCVFFALSGYLSYISALNDNDFSLKKYYLKRIKKLYLPLIFVVLITVFLSCFFPNNDWFNLKPETTSILFGYNNYWQLNANMDYFSRHTDSPFMHLWYISIIMQFDLFFPLIYKALNKVKEKFNKKISFILIAILSFASFTYFCITCLNSNIMITYYSSFARAFSWLFGIALGVIYSYFGFKIPKKLKNKNLAKKIIYVYLFILLIIFTFVGASSKLFLIFMIITSLISCRLIEYSTIYSKKRLSTNEKKIKFLSDISYEIYLVQYPIIYLFQNLKMLGFIKILLILVLVLLCAFLLKFSFDIKNKSYKKIRNIFLITLSLFVISGFYKYIKTKDYTNEMKELEDQLTKNEEKVIQNQQSYNASLEEEQKKWNEILQNLEDGEEQIKEIVTNLPVVGIGDSVMLGAIDNLHITFPNSYIDAKVSRNLWKAKEILTELDENNQLGDPIIINLGANGDCSLTCKKEIIESCKEHDVFWLNTTNNKAFNDNLALFSSNYSNLHIIDWNNLSKGHEEYFYADGIHLTNIGRKAYTKVIYDAIYQTYLSKYNRKKEKIINEHEQLSKNKITFYGNSLLLNAYSYIYPNFLQSRFVINKEFNFELIKKEIKKDIENKSLSYKVVFAFDASIFLTDDNYQELIDLCKKHQVYIVSINNNLNDLLNKNENVTVLNFYNEIKNNNNYLLADKKHLTDKGNEALNEFLQNNLM